MRYDRKHIHMQCKRSGIKGQCVPYADQYAGSTLKLRLVTFCNCINCLVSRSLSDLRCSLSQVDAIVHFRLLDVTGENNGYIAYLNYFVIVQN